jgi:hypothetical protein
MVPGIFRCQRRGHGQTSLSCPSAGMRACVRGEIGPSGSRGGEAELRRTPLRRFPPPLNDGDTIPGGYRSRSLGERISARSRVTKAAKTRMLIFSWRKRALASPNTTFAPPGWKL